jgi:hypothetical protein
VTRIHELGGFTIPSEALMALLHGIGKEERLLYPQGLASQNVTDLSDSCMILDTTSDGVSQVLKYLAYTTTTSSMFMMMNSSRELMPGSSKQDGILHREMEFNQSVSIN